MGTWRAKEKAIRQLEKRGKVDPNDLIEAAKIPSHPCHEDFTWDVDQAAQERWRDQARALIRKVKFEVIVEDVGTPVAEYVSLPDDDDNRFASLPKMRSVKTTSSVLTTEIRMLHGLASRVYGIAIAKQGMVGVETVATLEIVRDQIAGLLEE